MIGIAVTNPPLVYTGRFQCLAIYIFDAIKTSTHLMIEMHFFSLRETPKAFADYARLCYRELGAHVKMWITLNEPNDEMVSYQEGHQMLRAHALAWHAYDREFRDLQGGQVSGA